MQSALHTMVTLTWASHVKCHTLEQRHRQYMLLVLWVLAALLWQMAGHR